MTRDEGDFLSALEARLRRLERASGASNAAKTSNKGSTKASDKSASKSSATKDAKRRRVTFGTTISARGFIKTAPPRDVGSPVYDSQEALLPESACSDDAAESMSEEESEDDFSGEDLAPGDELRMLSEPVSGSDEDSFDDSLDGSEDEGEFSDASEEPADASDDSAAYSGEDESEDAEDGEDDAKSQKKRDVLSAFDVDSDEEDAAEAADTPFSQRQERMRKTIHALEDQSVAEKAWMFRGEVGAAIRPINSLLEQDVDFVQIARAAPPVTAEMSESLEKIIMQRITDRAWDDPARRERTPVPAAGARGKDARPLAAEAEGPKRSLSEVYDEEARKAAAPKDAAPKKPVDARTQAAHDEITALFTKVCRKLDALSKFKFAPHYEPLAALEVRPDARFTKKQL